MALTQEQTNLDLAFKKIGADVKKLQQPPICIATMPLSQQINGDSFTTIKVTTTEGVDTAGAFDNATNFYNVPVNGIYRIDTKIRITDGFRSNESYGQGAHTSNVDGTWFLWGVSAPNRNGLLNSRTARFTAGQPLRLYCYIGGGGQILIDKAEMIIVYISK